MHPRLIFAYVWLAKQIRARAGVILTGLTVLTVVGGVLAFQAEGAHRGDPMSVAEAIYSTLGLFAFAGNRFGFPQTWPLVAVYFLAPYITASALLEAAFQMLSSRNSILLTGMRGHTVICGAGTLGVIVAQEHDRARTPTVLVNEDIPDSTGGTSALVVVGDMKREATLRSARAESAGRVYLTTGDDLVNLEVATRLARQFDQTPDDVGPAVYCHIADASLRDTLLGPHGPGRVNYFNSYRLSAKALVARMFAAGWLPALHVAGEPDDETFLVARAAQAGDRVGPEAGFALTSELPDEAPELVVVVGLGRFGRAVAEQLAELLPARTHLRVVDSHPPAVEATRARLLRRPDVDVHLANVGDASWRQDLGARGKRALVFLCTHQDRENLRVAMGLARSARTVVRMFDQPFGERFTPAGGNSFELDVAGFRGLFHDAFPMLAYQHEVDGPDGQRIPRIRTCLRLPAGPAAHDAKATGAREARWYLTWLDAGEAERLDARSAGDAQRICDLPGPEAIDRSRIAPGRRLVRSGAFEALRHGPAGAA